MLFPTQIRRPNPLAYAFTAVAIVAIGIAASIFVYIQMDQSLRGHIMDRALTVAESLSIADISALAGDARDLESESYARLKSLLTRIREVNDDTRFVYLVDTRPNDTLLFLVDSEPADSPDYSPPGQEYTEATPAMHELFRTGQVVTEGPNRDRWGVWISAYAPVVDADGTVIALLGIDLPAYQYMLDIAAYSLLPLLIALLLLVLVTGAERLHAREFQSLGQKAEFLSIASHEIRTPLTGIRWAVESVLTSKKNPVPDDLRVILEHVHESCLMLIARVNNLLDVTALENRGSEVLHKSTITIPSFVEEIVDSLSLSAMQRNVEILIDPSVALAGSLTADPQTMHHVFFNLIANGVKYTNPGTHVVISYAATKSMHVFTVADEGPGMSPHDQQRIFEGYHRTPEAVRSGQYGSGLGLYLVRKATEMHRGTVTVESSPGKGARFTLSLPKD